MAVQYTKADQIESRTKIESALKRAARDRRGRVIIYTVLRRVGSNGTSRLISPMIVEHDTCTPVNLAWDYERALNRRSANDRTGQWAVKVRGTGMDMGFHLAESLARMAGVQDFEHQWL